jgi:N-acyl-D-amino-acid deacylase
MELPEAIRKITSRPAECFGLADRGRVGEGLRADLVVFDADRIGSPATYERPEQPPEGIHCVLRNGGFTVGGPDESRDSPSRPALQ